MSNKKKYFGTDGIRGRVGEAPITADFMLKLGWATGRAFARDSRGCVLVGKDTRISGYMFESALEAGLTAAGIDTHLLGPIPTPGIAYLTRTLHAQAGIVISASHNPYYDNGIKFFSSQGVKLEDEMELKIERYLDSPMTTITSARLGKAKHIVDAAGRYIEFCKNTITAGIDFKGLRIVIDCAHGATYHIAPHVFSEAGADVVPINIDPDGTNINNECGSTCPQKLVHKVQECRADFGIALDGDGDRLVMVDHKGEIVDGDELIYIIANARLKKGNLSGPVVGTLMSNLGMEQALAKLGIDLIRANVGDRYVMKKMVASNSTLGGENSGHIICLDKTTTGDGIVSALQVIAELNHSGKSLHELKQGMVKYPQLLINVRANKKVNIDKIGSIQKTKKAIEKLLGVDGRVLLRSSGTEPLVRVMVEGIDQNLVASCANNLAEEVKKHCKISTTQ